MGRRRFGVFAGLACGVAAGIVVAVAAAEDGPDHFQVAAGTTVTAVNSGNVTFSVASSIGTITVTCGFVKTTGKTGTTLSFPITPPKFSANAAGAPCTDSANFKDMITTNSTHGAWTVREVDVANDEGTAEPNAGDHAAITIPKAGLIDHNTSASTCVITLAPAAAATITGTYSDGTGLVTLAGATVPVSIAGCPVTGTSTKLSGKNKLTPILVDKG